jgi:hypothetical protein
MHDLGETIIVIRGFDLQRVEASVGLVWSFNNGEKQRGEELSRYVDGRNAGRVVLNLGFD